MSDAVYPGESGGLSLEEWIALNGEMAALVRAGLPLEQGLLGFGQETGGRLGDLSSDLSARLSRGETLIEALAGERSRMPKLYRAAVEAGIRSGRLATALEQITEHARHVLEMRRAISVALIYPLMVFLVAYGLFVAFVTLVVPRFLEGFTSLRLPGLGLLRMFDTLGRHALAWAPWPPLVMVLVLLAWWYAGRASRFGETRLLRWLPWTRRMLDDSSAAHFAELTAVLLDHGVPFPEAVRLAGEASGSAALEKEGAGLAEAAVRGDSVRMFDAVRKGQGMPVLLGWLLGSGYRQGTLVPALRHAAATYRRRTTQRAEFVRRFLPVLATVTVGGLSVLFYGVMLFLPFVGLLKQLSQPN